MGRPDRVRTSDTPKEPHSGSQGEFGGKTIARRSKGSLNFYATQRFGIWEPRPSGHQQFCLNKLDQFAFGNLEVKCANPLPTCDAKLCGLVLEPAVPCHIACKSALNLISLFPRDCRLLAKRSSLFIALSNRYCHSSLAQSEAPPRSAVISPAHDTHEVTKASRAAKWRA